MNEPRFGEEAYAMTANQWLRFVWCFGCCSGNQARRYLASIGIDEFLANTAAEAVADLPEALKQRIAEEIGRRVVNMDRSLDPKGFRSGKPTY